MLGSTKVLWLPPGLTNMRESRFVPTTCIGQSSVAWRLLTRPNEEKEHD